MQSSDVISSLFWFKNESDVDEEKEPQILEQFVHNVEDFSSQYGSEISVSYTAFNLRGPPSNFPDYGDYPQAFVMRTYGTWWEEAPSAQQDYMPQNASAITSQDFVEVSFEKAVYPLEVSIFETYNPGALVRMWALGPTAWMLLWEGEPEYVGDTPRIFSPPIRQLNVPSRMLRLEFNHKLLPYYTELDAVLLRGKQPPNLVKSMRNNFSYSSLFYKKTQPVVQKGQLLNRIIASNLHETLVPQIPAAWKEYLIDTGPPLGDFERLPILCTLSFLANGSYQKIIKENIRTYLSQPSASRCINEVVEALNNPAIVKKYIRFPQNIQERQMLKERFYKKFGFPAALGCIDGTLVALKKPVENEERFYCRKGYHARNVQLDETILCVMKYLDIQSLCRCAQVNRHFYRLASDAILYKSIDLRPYWHCVQSQVLINLSMRCKFLQKLDLSWCGSHRMIQPNYVVNFLKDSGAQLTHLRMNCCRFVDNSVLRAIVDTSTCLQELCLRSVVGCSDWICLSALKKLKRLDLYRTDITTSAAVAIVRSNPALRHLNFGSCKMISSMDEVAIALGGNCPDLISVDFWKSYSLTPNGIRALGNCMNLEELDVGWCLQAGGSGEWLAWLSGGELRKLFLGALRGVCDRDLRALLPRAPKLAQLDLLGVRAVTPDICDAILAECRDLRLLDVSFCDQIQESQVLQWREQYPHVSIKRSFQSANLNTAPNPLFLAPSLE